MFYPGDYYLHENGDLIYKPRGVPDAKESPCVKKVWVANAIGKSPKTFVMFLAEAFKLGAKKSEILRLAEHNRLDRFYPGWRAIIFNAGEKHDEQ